jgi:translation initiation factor 2B subunit (eIF-2B alpha/beta/delta family)
MTILETIKAAAYGALGAAGASLIFWLIIIPIKQREARQGYVIQARATAAEAKANELQRQVNAGQIVISSYQDIAKNAKAAEQKASDNAEQKIRDNETILRNTGRSWLLDQSDIDELLDP